MQRYSHLEILSPGKQKYNRLIPLKKKQVNQTRRVTDVKSKPFIGCYFVCMTYSVSERTVLSDPRCSGNLNNKKILQIELKLVKT